MLNTPSDNVSSTRMNAQRLDRRLCVIHPLLLAAFPTLSLLSSHLDSVPIRDAYRPVVVAISIAVVLGLVLRPILKDPRKRGVAVSAFLVLFFGYGPLVNALRSVAGHRYSFSGIQVALSAAIVGSICAGALYGLRRTRRNLDGLTAFLNRASVVAILIPIAIVSVKAMRDVRDSIARDKETVSASPVVDRKNLPSIYYIILDAYARRDILADLFHCDNSEFLSNLRNRGFYIAERSRSNYCWTYLSLSASLNLDYLDRLTEDGQTKDDFLHQVMTQFRRSQVSAVLRSHGYTIVSFTSGYSATDVFEADARKSPRVALTEFENVLINMTPIRVLLNRMADPWQYFVRRRQILYTLDELPRLRREEAPLFVFAHIVAPHPPFVLDERGQPTHAARPFGLLDGADFYALGGTQEEYLAGYIKQLKYLNQRMIHVIDQILVASPNSVIILQADHGSKSRFTDNAETTDFREAFAILNAFYLPNRDASTLLYDSISPVNTFRTVFNAYFGMGYPLLQDRSYFCEWKTPGQLLDVTEKAR